MSEMSAQKERLDAYALQARFALAYMYDLRRTRQKGRARRAEECAAAATPASRTLTGRPRNAARLRRRHATSGAARRCSGASEPGHGARAARRLTRSAARGARRSPTETRTRHQDRSRRHPGPQERRSTRPKAMENYRAASSSCRRPIRALRAEALRRLGRSESRVRRARADGNEVTSSDLQGAEAIRLYATLLKAYPDYPRNDQVLYQLARAYETTGQPEQALVDARHDRAQYPQSRDIAEVQFRRGEMLFSEPSLRGRAGRLPGGARARPRRLDLLRAEPLQARLVAIQAGHERGQPQIVRRPARSDADDPNHSTRMRPWESLGRADRELVEDTLRVMSITFSYLDGAKSLDEFIARRGKMTRHTRGCCIRVSAICTSTNSATRMPPPPIARSSAAIRSTSTLRCCRWPRSRLTARAALPT